jgi:hypothetical protein
VDSSSAGFNLARLNLGMLNRESSKYLNERHQNHKDRVPQKQNEEEYDQNSKSLRNVFESINHLLW